MHGFITDIASLRDGQWRIATALYAERDGAEFIRIRFNTFKHSLLLISPLNQEEFKTMEQLFDSDRVKNILRDMKPMDVIFRRDSLSFRNIEPKHIYDWRQITTDFSKTGIYDNLYLNRLTHISTIKLIDLIYSPSPTKTIESQEQIYPPPLAQWCEKLLPLDNPFLFYIIDDPTGAILMMGRFPGYDKLNVNNYPDFDS
jgi:serine protease inhibitor